MSAPPKIAIITGGLRFGGSTSFVLQLACGFRVLNVPCAVFSLTRENPFAQEFEAAGIPFHVSDENRVIFEDRLTGLYKKIVEFNPTAIIANIGADAYEMLRYMPSGVGRIGVVHDLAMEPARLIPAYEDVLDGVVVVNSYLVEDVRRPAPKVNCHYLAHGIPLPIIPPRVPNLSEPLKVLYFGRLYPGKGTRFFPEIINDLQRRKVPFQFRIHGEGPEDSYLRRELANHLASGVAVLSSNVPRAELYPLIREHDVFIMASEHEGGPLTLLEAMSLGLVPVCNDIPCLVQEVVNSENGFRIPRNAEAFAEAIASLHHNRPQLERLSAAAHKTITSNYSIESMAKRYLDFITSLGSPQTSTVWPSSIRPKPIRLLSPTSKFLQRLGILRPARRMLKNLKSTRSR
jgi:glycosyltransferase involved in cell wall biosynthesis